MEPCRTFYLKIAFKSRFIDYPEMLRYTKIMSNRIASLALVALREALKVPHQHRHGALVLASGGRVLAKGCNDYQKGKHAEISALNKVPHDAKGSVEELIVVRARRDKANGPFALSKPCPQCQKAMKEAGVKTVRYSVDGEIIATEYY